LPQVTLAVLRPETLGGVGVMAVQVPDVVTVDMLRQLLSVVGTPPAGTVTCVPPRADAAADLEKAFAD